MPTGAQGLAGPIPLRQKNITCSPFCSEQLISDYSYSRDGSFELFFQFKITITGGVAAPGINFQFPVTTAVPVRGKTVSNENIRYHSKTIHSKNIYFL